MFSGEKVRLRAYRKEDAPLALEYINDPEIKRLLNPAVPFPLTLDEEEKWIASQASTNAEYNFAIEDKQTGAYLGGCGFYEVNWKDRRAKAGIFLGAKELWGQGYGSDALGVLVRFAFEQMNLNKLSLQVFGFNERAIRCYEKAGFKIEGRLRQQIFKDGQYHEEMLMGLLREEWPAQ